jgi:hypothetical protein
LLLCRECRGYDTRKGKKRARADGFSAPGASPIAGECEGAKNACKTCEIPRKRRLPAETEPAIARLRKIVAQSTVNQLLAEGSEHPDTKLLDLCAEALHLVVHAERANQARWDPHKDHAEMEPLWGAYLGGIQKSKPVMGRIRNIPAVTAAGIYAKALVVRASGTGAEKLAMSLATDLIACPGLRASLWPPAAPVLAEEDAQP